MGLYKKLVKIQKEVRGFAPNKNAGTYNYVAGSKVLDYIRPKMDELGILLVQQVDSIENERMDYQVKSGAKSEILSKVMMTFIWIDSETGETLPVKFGANGQNSWDKGLGSALTYAERYFLLKFFHIATDEDDVDAIKREDNPQPVSDNWQQPSKFPKPETKTKTKTDPEEKIAITPETYHKFVEAAARGKKTPKGLTATQSFIAKYKPSEAEVAKFMEDVDNYRINNNI